MRVNEKTAVREIHDRAMRLYRMRAAAVAALLVTYYLASYIGNFHAELAPLLVLGFCEIALNFPFPFFFGNSERAFKYLATSVMIDFMVETLVIHFIGGIDAMFFSAVYLLSILYCAMNLPQVFNFLMATLASLLYAGLIAAEYYDIIPHISTVGLNLSGMDQIALVISHVAFFYLIAIFARYLTNALIDKEKRTASLLEELREANQRIKYAHRMKSEFIAHLTHELRSPMNTIIGYSNLLKEPEIGPLNPRQSDYIDSVARNAKHLLDLINDVLDISKLEARKAFMEWVDADFVEIIRQGLDVFHEEALRKQIKVTFENETDPKTHFLMDVRKMRQIFYNLISNALKFTPTGGKVTVRLEKVHHQVILTVSDTGIGIAHEDQSRIFNPYEQAHHPYAPEMTGTGLGLAITKRFVEMHGAKIHVESRPHAGSRFIIKFPAGGPQVFPHPNHPSLKDKVRLAA